MHSSYFFRVSCRYFMTVMASFCMVYASGQNRDISNLSSGGKLNPLQAIMDIRHYSISLDVDIAGKKIEGYTEITVILSQKTDTLLFDLIQLYDVKIVKVNTKTVRFENKNDKIYITAAETFVAGNR